MRVRTAICGASGYTALELIRILLRHSHASIEAITTREQDRPRVDSLHRSLAGRIDLACETFDPDRLKKQVDLAFLCLPHGAAAGAAKPLLEHGVRVIDLSADYRLRDPNVYAEWYGESHRDVANLSKAIYGLTEFNESSIASAELVANPGCYPTSAILGLAPLMAENLVDPHDVIIDSKSGVTGAGRTPKLTYHFPECNESFQAYGVGNHRHTPEINQGLSDLAGRDVSVTFTPHLVPMDKGILSTSYVKLKGSLDQPAALEAYRSFYADKPFVRVVEQLPTTKDVRDTNFCDVALRVAKHRLIVVSCIDNMIKGASGAAVQNMNVMFGLPQTTGLL